MTQEPNNYTRQYVPDTLDAICDESLCLSAQQPQPYTPA